MKHFISSVQNIPNQRCASTWETWKSSFKEITFYRVHLLNHEYPCLSMSIKLRILEMRRVPEVILVERRRHTEAGLHSYSC